MEKLSRLNIVSAYSNDKIDFTSQPCVHIESSLDPRTMSCLMGVVPIIYVFVDCHQFSPMSTKAIHNVSADIYTDSSDLSVILDFQHFINTCPAYNTYSLVVIMK